jgi:hypothetical protein
VDWATNLICVLSAEASVGLLAFCAGTTLAGPVADTFAKGMFGISWDATRKDIETALPGGIPSADLTSPSEAEANETHAQQCEGARLWNRRGNIT